MLRAFRRRDIDPKANKYSRRLKNTKLDCRFRADLIVADSLLIELKAVEKILPIHEAQILTYLKLTDLKFGLILNFNSVLLKNGIRRFVL